MNPLRHIAVLASVLLATAAQSQSFSYADFTNPGSLTLNGSAAANAGVLRLVPSAESQAGSAFRTTALETANLSTFSSYFVVQVTPDPASALGLPDGFAFVLQSQGANALGEAGQGMGYAGLASSVAVVFRGRGPAFIGVITGGVDPAALPTPFSSPGAVSLTEGSFYGASQHVWIDYAAGTLSVYLSGNAIRPATALMSTALELGTSLGAQTWVGFSAGNGGAYGSQDVLSWEFTAGAVPEPASLALLVAGLLCVTMRLRRGG